MVDVQLLLGDLWVANWDQLTSSLVVTHPRAQESHWESIFTAAFL